MAEGNEKTSLKQLIQGMTGDSGVEVLQGMVKSVNPLKIQMVNDEKLVIGPNITYIPRHLTDYTVACSIPKENDNVNVPASDGSRFTNFTLDGSITIHNALQTGEKVHVLAFNHGKQYYVLDRVG